MPRNDNTRLELPSLIGFLALQLIKRRVIRRLKINRHVCRRSISLCYLNHVRRNRRAIERSNNQLPSRLQSKWLRGIEIRMFKSNTWWKLRSFSLTTTKRSRVHMSTIQNQASLIYTISSIIVHGCLGIVTMRNWSKLRRKENLSISDQYVMKDLFCQIGILWKICFVRSVYYERFVLTWNPQEPWVLNSKGRPKTSLCPVVIGYNTERRDKIADVMMTSSKRLEGQKGP